VRVWGGGAIDARRSLAVSNSNFISRHFDLDNVTNMSPSVKVAPHILQKYHFDLCNYKRHVWTLCCDQACPALSKTLGPASKVWPAAQGVFERRF